MSTKSHILYNQSIEVYHECSEPASIFGTFKGDNIYFIVEWDVLEKVEVIDDYLFVDLKENELLPRELKFWGGLIVRFEVDQDGLLIIFDGAGYNVKHIANGNFKHFIKNKEHE